MRMLSVPEGTWSGTSGVPAPHLMRGERGSVPASRSAWRDFECWSADATEISRREKRAFFVTVYDGAYANIKSSLPRGSKRERLPVVILPP
jgi:hypothetical protein